MNDTGTPTSIATLGNPGRVDSAPVKDSTPSNPDWQAVTAAVSKSVVAIQVTSSQGGAEGSGLILDDKGHVLTNNHVVAGAQNNTVQVTLSDGRLFQAKIVGTDATTDLAVVAIQSAPSDLTPVALGDSDDVSVGDPVLAVGNPLGLANTATTGIVSALDRPVSASGENTQQAVVTNAIQIDAAINPGNSGGPLFDASGRVIGITSSIASLSSGMSGQSGSIGLGFAIPINLAKNISAQLIENGSAQHAFLGVSMQDGTATADGVTRRGAQVQNVTGGSPAAEAGVQAGDVVVAIGEQPVSSAESLTAFVRERQAGDKVVLTVVRNGSAQQITVTLAVRDETALQQGQPGDQGGSGQGGSDQGGSEQGGSDQGGSGQGGSGQGDSGGPWDWLFPGSGN
ncbi:PDZ domain-containing protein [Xylanimonas allomyrinae]|uniref:PDZ domain-containing protein n=2 Tax=Xylanimonas allomyrinae TaxID=2509459 RepID=A0A4P6ETH7_9MICO|nr:PDZ domain-containing protein [Xylanimonas allomyrinae]